MTTPDNLYGNTVAVRIDGREHRDWLAYDIDSDFLIPADGFEFELGGRGAGGRAEFGGQTLRGGA